MLDTMHILIQLFFLITIHYTWLPLIFAYKICILTIVDNFVKKSYNEPWFILKFETWITFVNRPFYPKIFLHHVTVWKSETLDFSKNCYKILKNFSHKRLILTSMYNFCQFFCQFWMYIFIVETREINGRGLIKT